MGRPLMNKTKFRRWAVVMLVVVGGLCGVGVSSKAADRAIVANEQEVNALIQLIDEALKAKGISVAQNAIYWLNKINTAPIVTDQKEVKPDTPKE